MTPKDSPGFFGKIKLRKFEREKWNIFFVYVFNFFNKCYDVQHINVVRFCFRIGKENEKLIGLGKGAKDLSSQFYPYLNLFY